VHARPALNWLIRENWKKSRSTQDPASRLEIPASRQLPHRTLLQIWAAVCVQHTSTTLPTQRQMAGRVHRITRSSFESGPSRPWGRFLEKTCQSAGRFLVKLSSRCFKSAPSTQPRCFKAPVGQWEPEGTSASNESPLNAFWKRPTVATWQKCPLDATRKRPVGATWLMLPLDAS
jgi:hypothetical protein